MNEDLYLVSVILPTYNRGHLIERAINSVINQTYENWELIVVDDGSQDDTEMIIKGYTDKRIRYIGNQKNKGANYCRNKGVRNSKGDYIAFLDSDNYWEKNKLELQLEKILTEELDLVFCRESVKDGLHQYFVPEEICFDAEIEKVLFEKNIIDTNTVLMKKECFEKTGGFDEKMPRLQDWEFFFRIVNVYGHKAAYMPECLDNNIIQKDSISKDNAKLVDAVLMFMHKYIGLYNDMEQAGQHILIAASLADGNEKYTANKIYEYFSHEQEVMEYFLAKSMMRFQQLNKYVSFYSLLYKWKFKSGERGGESIFYEVFRKKNMSIAIYGLGKWGELFYQDIKNLPVIIAYCIDKKAEEFHFLPIKRPEDKLEAVDMIVVTVFQEFEEIKTELYGKCSGEIVSIETLIDQA